MAEEQQSMNSVDDSGGEFRIHYHLANDKHQMDASVRNQCEAEVLLTVAEVARTLGIFCRLETRAYGQGGLQEFLTILGQNKDQIATLTTVLVPLFAFANWAVHIRGKHRLTDQQIRLNELVIQKTRLELRRLERQDADESTAATQPLALEPPPAPEEIALALIANKRIAVRRSNFYRKLLASDEITAVGFASAHAVNSPEFRVDRNKFGEYIVDVGDLEPTRLEKVKVEIISPVLRSGANKWRGLMDKRSFSFDLEDREFREAVLNRKVQFQNGTTLLCDMDVLLRENEQGEVETVGYVVTHVHEVVQAGEAEMQEDLAADTDRRQMQIEIREAQPTPPARLRIVQHIDGTEDVDDGC